MQTGDPPESEGLQSLLIPCAELEADSSPHDPCTCAQTRCVVPRDPSEAYYFLESRTTV